MNNMARPGTRRDNIIIQAVANFLNIAINSIESDANFSSATVINPVNTDRQRTNIYIGPIQEYHFMQTTPVLNSNTYEIVHVGMSQFKNQQVQIKANKNNVSKGCSHFAAHVFFSF